MNPENKKQLLKGITLGLILSGLSSVGIGQIDFNHAKWAELKAKAKAENKLIFVDAYTTWCGPCKWMVKNIFPEAEVSKFYNESFINAKIDMEAGEGKGLAKEYTVNMYPTYLFVNGSGEVVHRVVGSMTKEEFIAVGKNALIPEKQFATLDKQYKAGNRKPEFMINYLHALQNGGLKTGDVASAYFSTQKEESLSDRANWDLMYAFMADYKSKEFNYLLKKTDVFTKKYTQDSVNNKIYSVYMNECMRLIRAKNEDSLKYAPLKEEIKKSGFKRAEELVLEADVNYYSRKKDYVKYAKSAAAYVDGYKSTDADELNAYAYDFYKNVKDKEMLAKAEGWAQKAYELKPEPQTTMDTYACLLFANGKKQQAIDMETKAIEIIKSDAGKYDQSFVPDAEKNIKEWNKQKSKDVQ